MNRSRQPYPLAPAVLCVLALVACAAVYAVAFGTSVGVDADIVALPPGDRTAGSEPFEFLQRALARTADLIVVLGVLGAAVLVGWRRRLDIAIACLCVLVGANATTFLLKPALASVDPFGGEADRSIAEAFPSGHATAAMSAALVAILAAPAAWRRRAAVAGLGFAGLLGTCLVALRFHYPSDVVGGYLVAAAWAAAAAAVTGARSRA